MIILMILVIIIIIIVCMIVKCLSYYYDYHEYYCYDIIICISIFIIIIGCIVVIIIIVIIIIMIVKCLLRMVSSVVSISPGRSERSLSNGAITIQATKRLTATAATTTHQPLRIKAGVCMGSESFALRAVCGFWVNCGSTLVRSD